MNWSLRKCFLIHVAVVTAFVLVGSVNVEHIRSCDEGIECHAEGFFGNPNNCSKFYRCVDYEGYGRSYTIFHFDCGEGTYFYDAAGTCQPISASQPAPKCAECMGPKIW